MPLIGLRGELFVTPTKSGLILLNFFSSMSKYLKIPLSVWIRMTVLFNLSTNKPLLYTNLAVRMIKNWTREGILRKDHFLTFWPLFDTQGTLFSLGTKFFCDLQALMKMFCYILGIFMHWWMSYASYRVKGALFVTPTKSYLILFYFFSSESKKLKIPLPVWIRMTLLINLSTNEP